MRHALAFTLLFPKLRTKCEREGGLTCSAQVSLNEDAVGECVEIIHGTGENAEWQLVSNKIRQRSAVASGVIPYFKFSIEGVVEFKDSPDS